MGASIKSSLGCHVELIHEGIQKQSATGHSILSHFQNKKPEDAMQQRASQNGQLATLAAEEQMRLFGKRGFRRVQRRSTNSLLK